MKEVSWILENKEWIFSGIGVFLLGVIGALAKLIHYFIKKNSDKKVCVQKNPSFSISGLFIKKLKEKKTKEEKLVIQETDLHEGDREAEMSSTVLFDYKIRNQFPGVRGVKCFSYNKKIGERLFELLSKTSDKVDSNCFWWFRGSSNMPIGNFSIIDRKKCLMDYHELIIDKIYVYISGTYWRDFLYVITKPDKPTGLYKNNKKIEGIQINEFGNYYEEFGIHGKNKLTLNEYDDGAYEENGILIKTNGSEQLRSRYLAPYNFLICAHNNPINNSSYDKDFNDILNGILKGEKTVDDIVAKVEKMPKRDRNY